MPMAFTYESFYKKVINKIITKQMVYNLFRAIMQLRFKTVVGNVLDPILVIYQYCIVKRRVLFLNVRYYFFFF